MERWGIGFSPGWGCSIADLTEAARAVEEAGFDRIGIGDYHNDPVTWIHAIVEATTTIKVASTILNIALRHPVVTAEAIAGIRDLYGDRVELGLGVSHKRILGEELGVRVPSLDDLATYAKTVRAIMDGDAEESSHWWAPGAMHRDRSRAQRVPIPILSAALGVRSAVRATEYADGIILALTPTSHVAAVARAVTDSAASRGQAAPKIWVLLECFPGQDRAASARAAARYVRTYLELPAYRRMLAEAGFSAEVKAALRCDRSDENAISEALGDHLLHDIAFLGGDADLPPLLSDLRKAGADAVLLCPIDTGEGWRTALDRTVTTLAPPS